MTEKIFTLWPDQATALFAKHTVKLNHTLPTSPLFSDEALAEMIERVPRRNYSLVHMSHPNEPRHLWREGDLNGQKGRDVIEAVKAGRMWINLVRVSDVDPAYADLLNRMFGEMEANVPGFETFRRKMGILISSPNAQVFYHCDTPGQSLWQVRGSKRIWIYPNSEPFLSRDKLEGIFLEETEEEISYQPWFDDHAQVYDLEPGEMLHWPLNGPHRVVNHDVLNVSATTEHYTTDIRNFVAVTAANGILRRQLGWTPRSSATSGPVFLAKMALKKAYEKSGIGKRRVYQRKVDWKLEARSPNPVRTIEPYIVTT
jgi:hypothetical protein